MEHAHWINVQIMERFKAEGIDFAFPTQRLHLAGDENRPLTVDQQRLSEEEEFPQSALLAQAGALGAQTVLTKQVPAGESIRPYSSEHARSQLGVEGKLTDAPLEDDVLHGDDEGEVGEDEVPQR